MYMFCCFTQVLQRRVDGSVEFYRDWDEYKDGFGFLKREFWLGNDKISQITNQKDYMLRIDLNNQNGAPYFAKYDLFRISDEKTKYRLVGLGVYDSASTTGMLFHSNVVRNITVMYKCTTKTLM